MKRKPKLPTMIFNGWAAIARATGYSEGTLRIYHCRGILAAKGFKVATDAAGRVSMTSAQVFKLAKQRQQNAV